MLLPIRVKNYLLAAASCAALHVQGVALAAGSSNAGVCSPPALGAPCPRGGATTQGMREPEPGFELGNPVHLASGNKYQLEVDLPPNPSAPGLELVRHYNGLSIQGGTLGRNWSLSYDARLMRRNGEWLLRQGDGSLFRAPSITPHGDGHVWNWPNGRALHFDASGRLVRIRNGSVTQVWIHRYGSDHTYAGEIERIETPGGLALKLHYGSQDDHVIVNAIDTPRGRFTYHYEQPPVASGHRAPRLVAVSRPDGMRRIYHYEDALSAGNPYALTGVSLQAPGGPPQRLSSWEYDRQGRVIGLRQHGRRLPELRIEYLRAAQGRQAGHTRVHSSNGRWQDFHFERHGGAYRRIAPGLARGNDGRLTAIEGLRLERSDSGVLTGVIPRERGWPGLALHHDPTLRRHGWRSEATGAFTIQSDALGRPNKVEHANGDTLSLTVDAQGRPSQIEETSGRDSTAQQLRLQWRGRHLVRIDHPAESESRRLDDQGRLVERVLRRPAGSGMAAVQFREAFHYDDEGRITRHDLPEGGALHYQWSAGPRARLESLIWVDARKVRRVVLTTAPGRPGYSYGNGLRLVSFTGDGVNAGLLQLTRGDEILWRNQRRYDAAGHVMADIHDYPPLKHHDHQVYAYDANSRLVGARHRSSTGDTLQWFAWHDDGRLAASRSVSHTSTRVLQQDLGPITAHRDPAGMPTRFDGLFLRYGPGRRLQTVTRPDSGEIVAHYGHNALGHRVTKTTLEDRLHFVYLDGRLVAEARPGSSGTHIAVSRRYLYAGAAPVGLIEYTEQGPQLHAVHADLSGAPRLVTDAAGEVRWLASYTPLGEATRVAGDLAFPLRFPGQYADTETGWHDNLLRTYSPRHGHFLEPDPLGPLPGTQAFGYAAQQPWRYADPTGLLLFAFDGTRYSSDVRGNVWKLAETYQGDAHYHSGPGNSLFLDWDAIVAWQAGRILENQWQALLTSLERHPRNTVLPIDIIGFSRGAALARHFGNRIAAHTKNGVFSVDDPMRGHLSACVDLRFMGLFDTVAQFGIGGSHNHLYDFGVAHLWSWVSHAVALHEHRWAFPLMSADAGGAGNVVEAGFVGAHADIGGGVALQDPGDASHEHAQAAESDLAKVALAWMHWQAMAATTSFDALETGDTNIRAPWLRDMRSPWLRSIQRGDRAIMASSGTARQQYQDDDPRLGSAARTQAEAFIERLPDWRSTAGEVVGKVDMTGYAQWLQDTLGWAPH